MVEKDAKFRLMVANGGKTHYFQRGSRSPWISAEVKNPSTIAFSHFDPQDPPVGVSRKGAPVFVLRQHPSAPLPSPSANPPHCLSKTLRHSPRESENAVSQIPDSDCGISVCRVWV